MSYKALLVRHDSSAFEGTTEEAFKHHLLHQVTYDTVLKAVKREGHALAANWLAGRVGDRADEYLGVTAEHFERAGDAAKALDYFERAARAAKARFAIHEALAYLARELALPELSAPLRRFRVLDRQAEAADWLGDRSLQEAALIERAALAEAVGDDALRPESLSNRALLADRRGDQVSAAALAMDAVRLAEQVGLAHVASVAHGELAWVTRRSPRVTTPRALALTRQMGWRVGEATAVLNLGQCALARGNVAAALARADETFEIARQIEDPSIMARSFILRADALVASGDRPEALATFEASRARYQAMGAEPWVAITSALIAEQCLALGDFQRAQAEANRVLQALAGAVSLDGTGEEMRVRYLCFTVLHRAAEDRAAPHIEALYVDLQAVAARIADVAMRRAMLENVDTHRKIITAWAAQQAAS